MSRARALARARSGVRRAHAVERQRLVEPVGVNGEQITGLGRNGVGAVPAGADCYVMRHIIHDWDDEKSITILRRCREAMRPGGKVLVVESVVPPGNEPHFAKFCDLIMLAVPGGRERTAEEYEDLYAAAGLKVTRIVPTAAPVSVVEGCEA